jgi:hypothetical protein
MKRCKTCGYKFAGRSDRKFCSDICRSDFHNKKYKREKDKAKAAAKAKAKKAKKKTLIKKKS